MSGLNRAVPARQGITLWLEQDSGRVRATIIRSRDNTLSQLFRDYLGVAESLRKAERFSLDDGFGGYYHVMEPDEWLNATKADLEGAIAEIKRQSDTLLPRAGIRWGLNGPALSSDEWANIDPARAQISRLAKLRDTLLRLRRDARVDEPAF